MFFLFSKRINLTVSNGVSMVYLQHDILVTKGNIKQKATCKLNQQCLVFVMLLNSVEIAVGFASPQPLGYLSNHNPIARLVGGKTAQL